MPDDIAPNRAHARRTGARFYSGSECQAHPESPRYTANARCAACCKDERRIASATPAAKERDRERKRAWRAARPGQSYSDQFADLLG